MERTVTKEADESRQYRERYVKTYLCKMKGGRCQDLPAVSWSNLLVTATGSLFGIGLVGFLAAHYNLPLLFPSFGASAVLLYAACHVPMAQPRNVIGGHLISAMVGVAAYHLLGATWWSIALGVTLAILAMTVTHTLHPPGGATAFVAIYNGQGAEFIISPVGIGVICLVIIAVLVNNLSSQRKYPDYWF
ncbi:MAG: HPP family protein [Bacillota bacterium]